MQGDEATFTDLRANLGSFTVELNQMHSGVFDEVVQRIQERWQPVLTSARTLADA